MPKLTYPLLCWQLDEASVFGMLLGTDLQAVEKSAKRLKTVLAETLQRESERGHWVPEPEIAEPRLRFATVNVNLAHATAKGSFPVPGVTPFTVAAVHGDNAEDGYSKCYLPYLEESFFYYDDEQLPVLIEHYTRDRLDGLDPESAKRYLMAGKPWLEEVEFREKEAPASRGHVPRHLREAQEQLSTVADRLPESGARRGLHVFPEAAWEQGALVDTLAARIAAGGNVLLVGETGVGKSVAIAEAIRKANRLTQSRELPPTYWRSHAERLIGRAKYLGEWQALCDQLIDWMDSLNGVLWVTDFPNLLQAGGDSPDDSMAAYLLPAIKRGALRLVGEARPAELEAARRLLPGFVECFEPVAMPEMDAGRSRRVLDLFAAHAKQAFGVDIERPALETGHRLLHRYMRYECFPGKAVKFFGDGVRRALAEERGEITEVETIAAFARVTGLPELFLRDDLPLREGEVEAHFGARIQGQPAALAQLKEVVCTFKAGLNDPAKPIATLLFAGPTGVGKTAAAKALADFFFGAAATPGPGEAEGLFRIDMSEFQYAFQVTRLIGDGAQPGKLIEHVRRRPFTVVLLDEIEKADPSVFDLLLTVLDEGRLRDSRGRVTDFRSTLIVMTTNLGVRQGGSLGFGAAGPEDAAADALHEIRRFFRPEFFNRIDRVVPFAPLSREAIASIARAELAALGKREGLRRRGLSLSFSDEVVDFVAAAGFSPKYGARPLQRAVERHVASALAKALFAPVRDGQRLEVVLVEGAVAVRAAED